MELDYGQFVDLSNMTKAKREELFPILKTKGWCNNYKKFYILFRYPYGRYFGEIDEEDDYYDGYANDYDDRYKWIEYLKDDGVTQQVSIDDIGEL